MGLTALGLAPLGGFGTILNVGRGFGHRIDRKCLEMDSVANVKAAHARYCPLAADYVM